MKRYLLFLGPRYYPGGGWFDFKRSADTIEEATPTEEELELISFMVWWQIVDTVIGKVVKTNEG